MRRHAALLIGLLLSCGVLHAQENLVDLENNSTTTLNEELRKNRVNTSHLITAVEGGTTRQVLSKASADYGDTVWVDVNTLVTEPFPSIFAVFSGNGEDAAPSNASHNFSDVDGSSAGIAQYPTLDIEVGSTLTIDTKYAYIGVTGNCHIHGTITATGGNGSAHAGMGNGYQGTGPVDASDGTMYNTAYLRIVTGLSGGGGRSNITGGTNGYPGGGDGGSTTLGTTVGLPAPTYLTTNANIILEQGGLILSWLTCGGGGGGGKSGANNGGDGGGVIYIEVGGDLIVDGTISANGGVQTSGAGYTGGGGGVIIIRAKGSVNTAGSTITVTGGTSTSGYSGGNGYSKVVGI